MNGILIVDDEEMIRFLIRKEIESLNLDINVVGEAVDGHEGILLFRELRPSIIITDVRMPRIDGLKMINLIKKESPEVVVIILSAYAEFSYAQKAINEGALDYLLKPIDEDSLYRCLSSAINKSKEQQRSKTKLFKMEKELGKLQKELLNCTAIETSGSGSDLIDGAIRYVIENFYLDISLLDIAQRAFICTTYMSEQFKKRTGRNFSEYITDLRIEKAKILLKIPNLKINEISDLVGYHDCSYFVKVFKNITNKTPNEYRVS